VYHSVELGAICHSINFNASLNTLIIIKDFSFRDNRNMLKWEKRLKAGKLIAGMKIYEGTI
jgi:hypothetical protein